MSATTDAYNIAKRSNPNLTLAEFVKQRNMGVASPKVTNLQGSPIAPPIASAPFQRDIPRELAKATELGVDGFSYQQLSDNPAFLKNLFEATYSDRERAGLDEYQKIIKANDEREEAKQKLSSAQPPSYYLKTLETALRVKGGVGKEPIGQSNVFAKAGLGGFAVLQQSLAERGRELQDIYGSFTNTMQVAAGYVRDEHQFLADKYKLLTEDYNNQADQMNKVMGRIADYTNVLQLEDVRLKNDIARDEAKSRIKIEETKSDPTSNFLITRGTTDKIPDLLNNPGDLKAGGIGDQFAIRDDKGNLVLNKRGEGNFLTFATPEDGLKALIADLTAKQKGETRTNLNFNSSLLDFAREYAGSGQSYVDNIVEATGIDPRLPIGQIPVGLLAKGVAFAEGYSGQISEATPLTDLDNIKANDLVNILTKGKGTTEYKQALVDSILRMRRAGDTFDQIEDKMRFSGFGQGFTGIIKSAFDSIVRIGFTQAEKKDNQETFEDKIDIYGADSKEVKEDILGLAKDRADVETRRRVEGRAEAVNNVYAIKALLNQYIAKGGDTGVLKGNITKFKEKVFGTTGNKELSEIANQIHLAIVDYRKSITGAAFTPEESKEYFQIMPDTTNYPELNEAKINSILEVFSRNVDQYYRGVMGQSNFSALFPGGAIEYLVGQVDQIETIATSGLSELARQKAAQIGFDVEGAKKDGATIQEIENFLTSQ